jgi:MFS-type transporter involved in bile tolerance (Atg22 family)
MPRELQTFILFGGPGLLLGAILGALVPKSRVVIAVIVLSTIALLYGFEHFPEGAVDDDDDPNALLGLAMMTNFAGWIIGLVVGAGLARLRLRS